MAAATEDSAAARRWWLDLLPVEQQQQLPEPGVMRILDMMPPPAMSFFFDMLQGSGLRLADLIEEDVERILRQMLQALQGSSPLDGSSPPYRNVPASAAAVAGLEKQTVRAAGGDGGAGGSVEGCAI
ncbi:hypothetical protein ACP70R_031668 [Stipagrostis hirtigluma subsp. patula]